MINYVAITNHLGESLTLELRSPEKSGFFIQGIEGLGPSKSTINTTEVLASDGAFYNSSRITSRNIVFNIGFLDFMLESIETLRQKTYRYFPMKKPITIEVGTDNRVGVATGYVESNEPNIFSSRENTIISVLCPSSFFYGKDIVQSFFSGVSSAFEFPWENPSLTLPLIEMGTVFINTTKSILYTGDQDTGITIYVTFTGNVTNPTIANTSTGQTMTFSSAKLIALTGADFHIGDQLLITTSVGNKHVYLLRSGFVINIINALNTSADWFYLSRGDNVFVYTATTGVGNMQFLIEHRVVYGGM